MSTLPSPAADHPDEFESTAELVGRFMAFVADKFETEGEGEDVLLLVVAEFETRFLRGNEVHGMVSELDGDIDKKKCTFPAAEIDAISIISVSLATGLANLL